MTLSVVKLTFPASLSLKTRITLYSLGISLAMLWTLSYLASQGLRKDAERVMGEQQFVTVSIVASQLNRELELRLDALRKVAPRAVRSFQQGPAAMQDFLDEHQSLQMLFNGSLFITDADGIRVACTPFSSGRIGNDLSDRDYLQNALVGGKASVGKPIIARPYQTPVIAMAAPIIDSQGKIIGALSGVIELDGPSFLDQIPESHFSKTGGYLLVSRAHRLIITATEKARVLSPLEDRFSISLLERSRDDYESTKIVVNSLGEEVLLSAKNIPAADWVLFASLPTAEVFAPLYAMQRFMLLATIVLTLLAGALTWWMARRQLLPLQVAVEALAAKSGSQQPFGFLPVIRWDEIGRLVGSFNQLLETLGKRDSALRESEAQYRQLYDEVPVGYHEFDGEGRITRINQTELMITGYSADEMLGHFVWEFVSDHEQSRIRTLGRLAGSRPLSNNDERYFLRKDGTSIPALTQDKFCFDEAGKVIGIRTIMLPIAERKQAEEALRISEERYRVAFQTSQDAITIVRLSDGLVIEANQSFLDIHQFERDEIVGRTTLELNIWFEPADRQRFVDLIQRDSKCSNIEARFRRKDGELVWGLVSASVVELDGIPCVFAVRRDITERKHADEKINYMAFFDQLTGLPNRTLLQDRLKQAMASSQRSGAYGALLLLDLDYFKTLNDTLGHDTGDLMLKQVAQRLAGLVREEDTVARFGGDEFVVMLVNLSESAGEAAALVEKIGRKISAALSLPYELKETSYHISPSIGASLFLGQDTEMDTLLKQADLAMYKAKETGRNTLRFFDPDMAHEVSKRAVLENDLREAVQKQQFLLHYQIQISGHRCIGAEVLLRWRHPERGLISPAEFIPALERTGLILPVGQWVLDRVCQQLTAWAKQPELSRLTVAVNVSARQLNDQGFVEQILSALERSGADPERLKLELTESLLADNIEETIGKMSVLKAKGVGFSLDDFGTGYSSLAYLKRLPLDQLKIDQSFVKDILTDPNDAAIARMIVVLADSLGLMVIAEGVETEAQKEALAQQGCHTYQGYLFGRPVPLDEFELLVKHAGQ